MPVNTNLIVVTEEQSKSILRNDPPIVVNNKRRWDRLSMIISIFGRVKSSKDKSFMKIEKVALERKASIVVNNDVNKLVGLTSGSKNAHVVGRKKRGRRWHRLALMLSAVKEIKEKRKSYPNVKVDPPEIISIPENAHRAEAIAKFRRTIRIITMLSAWRRNSTKTRSQKMKSDTPVLTRKINVPTEIAVSEQRNRNHGWEYESGAQSSQSPYEGNRMQIPLSRASDQTNVLIMRNSSSSNRDIRITHHPTISAAPSSQSLDKDSERSYWWWPFSHIFSNDSKSVGTVTPHRGTTTKLARRHSMPHSNETSKIRKSLDGDNNNNYFTTTKNKSKNLNSPLFKKPSTVAPLFDVVPL